ncbi:MAG TPA: amidohydrolase family protein [Jatrophihabitans sp.]|nr:amidohydrolase family protein [Jatrophihabitans sp.]
MEDCIACQNDGTASRTAAAPLRTTGCRYRGLADMLGQPPIETNVMGNVFFDTCVYHQPGIDLLVDVVPVDNIVFGSEMIGAVRGIDPNTGHHFDDTRRYLDAAALDEADRRKIFEGNVRRVYPRINDAV